MQLPPDRALNDVHTIQLTSDKIVARPPYRTSPAESAHIKCEIDDMLKNKIIRPSNS